MLVAVVFLVGFGVGSFWGFGARSIPLSGEELLERAIAFTALPVLAGLLFCCIKLKSCRLSIVGTLTVLWLGMYTWLQWFGPSAPGLMTELFLDSAKMHAESLRHITLVAGMYLLVVGVFSLLPILKVLHVRREASRNLPV
jgi:hypothetical protein